MTEFVLKLMGLAVCFLLGVIVLKLYDFAKKKLGMQVKAENQHLVKVADHPRRELVVVIVSNQVSLSVIVIMVCLSEPVQNSAFVASLHKASCEPHTGLYLYFAVILMCYTAQWLSICKMVWKYTPQKEFVEKPRSIRF